MTHTYVRPTATIAAEPIYSTIVQFPAVCFTLALVTDIVYWSTAFLMWQNFSSWLLFIGLVTGGVAVLAGIFDFAMSSRVRASRYAWLHAIAGVFVLLLALLNSLIHAGDGWTAVVPWGLVLSALTVLAMILTAWLGRTMAMRFGTGDLS